MQILVANTRSGSRNQQKLSNSTGVLSKASKDVNSKEEKGHRELPSGRETREVKGKTSQQGGGESYGY